MDDLDDLLAEAGRTAPQPSPALMQRVLADATRLQPRPAALPERRAQHGFWAGLAAVFGGGAALAGVGSAAVAGLFFGFVQPAVLTNAASTLTASNTIDSVDLMPGLDALLAGE